MITRYHYRYLADNMPVYYLGASVKNKPLYAAQKTFFSEPYYIEGHKDLRNVVKAFMNKKDAALRKSLLDKANINIQYDIQETSLYDLKDLVDMINIPLVVKCESYCDIVDKDKHIYLYFHIKK